MNLSNKSVMKRNCDFLALVKRRTPYAKRRWDIFGPQLVM